MINLIPSSLKKLAEKLPCPLYITGGYVRNFLLRLPKSDCDIAAPLSYEKFSELAENNGFKILSVYKNTFTVKIADKDGNDFEFASFRKESYERGHTPTQAFFTENIWEDAARRDFKCNAVYFNIKNNTFVDPLEGMLDIKNRIISAVTDPDTVFCNDGLRLMRLCRQCGELDFNPEEKTLISAEKYSGNIKDISSERVFSELKMILSADLKYGKKDGHYKALKLLLKCGVLKKIIPELTLGENMAQRQDFHNYDVLEHSLKAVLYAEPEIRLAALLHDIGKPYCFIKNGNFHDHDEAGQDIAVKVLNRLKASNKEVEQVKQLTLLHMYDLNSLTKDNKIRLFIVKNYKYYFDLLKIKQADFSACKDETAVCPTVLKWERIRRKMVEESAPFILSDLKIDGNDLIKAGFKDKQIKNTLEKLFTECIINPKLNNREYLLSHLKEYVND